VDLAGDGADEADDGLAVGEDADDVGAPANFAVEELLGLLLQIWRPCSSGKAVKASSSSTASASMSAALVKQPRGCSDEARGLAAGLQRKQTHAALSAMTPDEFTAMQRPSGEEILSLG
jgi:hypothetical protein